jgi:hypothetical protein
LADVTTLVTGGGGHLGSHLVGCLRGDGAELAVTGYDLIRSTTPAHLLVDASRELAETIVDVSGSRASWSGTSRLRTASRADS